MTPNWRDEMYLIHDLHGGIGIDNREILLPYEVDGILAEVKECGATVEKLSDKITRFTFDGKSEYLVAGNSDGDAEYLPARGTIARMAMMAGIKP